MGVIDCISKKMRVLFFVFLIWTCDSMNIFDMPADVAEAGEYEMKDIIVPKLTGNWRDRAGNVVVSINNGYLNGCRILDCYNAAGGGGFGGVTLRIEESAGIRDLQIEFMIYNITLQFLSYKFICPAHSFQEAHNNPRIFVVWA